MDALLLYVNDWLSSKQIAQMDATEERAYHRLLLNAAKQPDCGLEKNEKRLAILSLLDEQWMKESPEWKYQFGVASGRKVLGCFFEVVNGAPVNAATGEPVELDPKNRVNLQELKPGRIYNERLLRSFAEYNDRHNRAVGNAKKRWAGKNATADAIASKTDATASREACNSNATRVESESESENKLSSQKTETPNQTPEQQPEPEQPQQPQPQPQPEKPQARPVLLKPTLISSDGFDRFYIPYCQETGKPVTANDREEALWEWSRLSPDDKRLASQYVPQYVQEHPASSPRLYKTPVNYLKAKLWTAVTFRPAKPQPRGIALEDIA